LRFCCRDRGGDGGDGECAGAGEGVVARAGCVASDGAGGTGRRAGVDTGEAPDATTAAHDGAGACVLDGVNEVEAGRTGESGGPKCKAGDGGAGSGEEAVVGQRCAVADVANGDVVAASADAACEDSPSNDAKLPGNAHDAAQDEASDTAGASDAGSVASGGATTRVGEAAREGGRSRDANGQRACESLTESSKSVMCSGLPVR
jgi:hypothetical protein